MNDNEKTGLGGFTEAVSGIPEPIQRSFFKAAGALLEGLLALPTAKLNQLTQGINDKTAATTLTTEAISRAAAERVGHRDRYARDKNRDIRILQLNYLSKLSSDVRGRAKLKCPLFTVSSTGQCNAILNHVGVAMKRRTRINYTPEQKSIIWDRYKQGESLHDTEADLYYSR